MTLEEILNKYQTINDYFDEKFPQLKDEYRLLARLGKISEELGELNSAIHGELGLHRDRKQKEHSTDMVAKEWADLFNTVVLFGLVLELDIPQTIDDKLKEIYQRLGIKDK